MEKQTQKCTEKTQELLRRGQRKDLALGPSARSSCVGETPNVSFFFFIFLPKKQNCSDDTRRARNIKSRLKTPLLSDAGTSADVPLLGLRGVVKGPTVADCGGDCFFGGGRGGGWLASVF